ncbi:MAG: LURP-one-related family protein [Saccharofermentans sp.]|nr:LURP-one-related family protein [Saccharofermentans sp.]
MKMFFRQRIISLLDSYDIYDENGSTLFTVKGKFGLSHRFSIYDANDREVAYVEEKIFTLLPKFSIHANGNDYGTINRKLSFFRPKYELESKGWSMNGDIFHWDYEIVDDNERLIADVSKKIISLSDQYWIEVPDEKNALLALLFVLAVDADKCSTDNR